MPGVLLGAWRRRVSPCWVDRLRLGGKEVLPTRRRPDVVRKVLMRALKDVSHPTDLQGKVVERVGIGGETSLKGLQELQ